MNRTYGTFYERFGGRSYGGADLFRKAIGKKNVELVKAESAKLYQEIIDNKIYRLSCIYNCSYSF